MIQLFYCSNLITNFYLRFHKCKFFNIIYKTVWFSRPWLTLSYIRHACCFVILFPLFHLRLSLNWENNNWQVHFSLPVFGNTGSILSFFQSSATLVLYPVSVVLNNFPFPGGFHGQAKSLTCSLYSMFAQWLFRSHSSEFLPKNAPEQKFSPGVSCCHPFSSEHNVRTTLLRPLAEKVTET